MNSKSTKIFNQTSDDAATLAAALRVHVTPHASEEFLRALRNELQKWAVELHNTLTTIPPPPPVVEESGILELDEADFDLPKWFEVGDHTRLLVESSLPIEIETILFDVEEALVLASQSYGRRIEIVGEWRHRESGRATARVRATE